MPQLAREVSRQAAEKAKGDASEDTPTISTGFERYAIRPMFHGMLYKLLTNPIYIGKVRHHDELFDGEHEPLIDIDLFEAVRRQLAAGAPVPQGGRAHKSNHLLSGLLYDDTGDPMGCVHTRKAVDGGIKRYLYYMSRRATKAVGHVPDSWRIPAREIDKLVRAQALRILQDQTLLSDWIQQLASTDHVQAGLARAEDLVPTLSEQAPLADQRETLSLLFSSISLSTTMVRFDVRQQHLVDHLIGFDDQGGEHADDASSIHVIELPVELRRRGLGMRIVIDSPYIQPEPDPALVDLIARSHLYLDRLTGPSPQGTTSIADAFTVDRADVGRILPLAFLSPKMLDAIMTGTQPEALAVRDLARNKLPILWSEQDMLLP